MHVAILLTRRSTVYTVAGAFDLIDYALRSCVRNGRGPALFGVSAQPDPRFGFLAQRRPAPRERPDWIFIPALEPEEVGAPTCAPDVTHWLRTCAGAGSLITAVGTGAFAIADAGLLDQRDGVTHASYSDHLARCYPRVRVRTDLEWVQHGNILISANIPWYELVLTVIASRLGPDVARQTARFYALDWRRRIDSPQQVVDSDAPAGRDNVIDRAQQWLSRHFAEHDLIARCARHLGLSRRSPNRRFKEVTGMTPMAFVLRARVRASQNLLRFTNHNIETIGYEVGYQDTTTFRKLFRRSTGMAPGAFRRTSR